MRYNEFGGRHLAQKTITVDGVKRQTTNSEGQLIFHTRAGLTNFWRWFGDSKMVDEYDRPLLLYHGTTRNFDKFIPSASGSLGGGIYLTTTQHVAVQSAGGRNMEGGTAWRRELASHQEGGNVIGVYARILNPAVVDLDKREFLSNYYDIRSGEPVATQLKRKGYDGVIMIDRSYIEVAAYSSSQLKSAWGNRGGYSPEDDLFTESK